MAHHDQLNFYRTSIHACTDEVAATNKVPELTAKDYFIILTL